MSVNGRQCAGCGGPLTDQAATDYCWSNCRVLGERQKRNGTALRKSCLRCGVWLSFGSQYDYCQRSKDCKRLYTRQRRTGGVEQIKKRSVFHPDDSGWIYGLTDTYSQVVYIGQTMALPEVRFSQHRYREHWWSERVAGFISFEVRFADLTLKENTLIHRYHPWGNVRCLPCGTVRIDRRLTPAVPVTAGELAERDW